MSNIFSPTILMVQVTLVALSALFISIPAFHHLPIGILKKNYQFGATTELFAQKKYDIGNRAAKGLVTDNAVISTSQTLSTPEIISSPIELTDDEEEMVEGLPDKQKFIDFYKRTVKAGKEMRLDQFMRYEEVTKLLDEELIFPDDINSLWISVVADASGLDENEAYELLCMVTDLPEPEDLVYLDQEYEKIKGGKPTLSFLNFASWIDVQDMLNEEALTMEQITELWRQVAGDLNTGIDRQQFSKINNLLDRALEEAEDDDSSNTNKQQVEESIDLTGVDIWSPTFDPKDVFDDESLAEITSFYEKTAGLKGIDFDSIADWGDVKDMILEDLITKQQLQEVWKEASKGKTTIDLDTFIRFNVKLDLLMEESDFGDDDSNEIDDDGEDAESFYRSDFKKLTGGGRLLRLDMLLGWSEVSELINDGILSQKKVKDIFEGLPKEPMGIPADTYGINEDTFVAFNGMLDILMDATGKGDAGTAVAPATLTASAPRPMPVDKELKIGSLGAGDADDSSTGLSQSELELMETLDKADNMLNSGSFTDFDQLIGDLNDPRLQALRIKDPNSEIIKGSLQDIVRELTQLVREQKRCGLDKPGELDAARMRDLIQAIVEQTARPATKDIKALTQMINGKWKLMYTNSEMFDFYNGITGFVNVFPASKFVSLSTEYTSDGFLAESKYYETLSSPLGPVVATVFSTWDLLKEMSFMTNDQSVVLRSYCTKVTAGPMEYEAQENWKSLRTMSMNELIYIDNNIKIMRNCGALRIFFVYERE